MDSVDVEVLRTSLRWLSDGNQVLLVTVVRTWGSSPRPEGALLAIRGDGAVVGSVSGGCIEDDLIESVRRQGITQTLPTRLQYGVTADEAHRFGLPCGGTIELVLEPLSPQSQIESVFDAVAVGRLVMRTLDMKTGKAWISKAPAAAGLSFDGSTLRTVHGPRHRLLVIGAGQLSRFLCTMALGLDYQVTVCDPRIEYGDDWHMAEVTVVRGMPDDVVIDMQLDARSAVVALTHDPKLDDLALMEALKTDAFYVGALGSRRNDAARRERLKEFDLSDAELSRLRGPAGIYIGSRTPAEIAISILAELTAAKNGVHLPTRMRVSNGKVAHESMS